MVTAEAHGLISAPGQANLGAIAWTRERPAYVVIIRDTRIARAVADCLRSGLRAIADPTPVVLPSLRGVDFLRQAGNGGLAGATLIALDEEELHGLNHRAFIATRPDGLGRTAGRYGGDVVTVLAAVAEDLVNAVVAQAAASRPARQIAESRVPGVRQRQWRLPTPSVSTAGALLSRIGAVWEQRNTRRVGMVVLAGALGFVGWMASDALHPQQAQAAQIGAHQERGHSSVDRDFDSFSAFGSTGGQYGMPDIGQITKQFGLPYAHDRRSGQPASLANTKHHKSANQPKKRIRADYRDGQWKPSLAQVPNTVPQSGSPAGVGTASPQPGQGQAYAPGMPPLSTNPLCANGSQSCSGYEWYDTQPDPQYYSPTPAHPTTGTKRQEPSVTPPAPAPPAAPGSKSNFTPDRIWAGIVNLGDAEVQGFFEFYGYASSFKGLEREKAGPGELPKKALKSLIPLHGRIAIGILGAELRGFLRAQDDTNGFTRPFDPNTSTYQREKNDRLWGQPPLNPVNPWAEPNPGYIDDLNQRLTPPAEVMRPPAPQPAPEPTPQPTAPPAAENLPMSQPDAAPVDSTSLTPPSATLTPPSAQLNPYGSPPPPNSSPPTNGGGSSDGGLDAPGGPTDTSANPDQQGPGTAPPSPDAPSPPGDDSKLL